MEVSDFSPSPSLQESRSGSDIAICVCPKPLEPAACLGPCRQNSHLCDCCGRSSLNTFSLREWKGFTSVLGDNFHDTDCKNSKISAVHTFLLEG